MVMSKIRNQILTEYMKKEGRNNNMKTKESFIVNECISAIKSLAGKNPNDMLLGGEVRAFLNSLEKDR